MKGGNHADSAVVIGNTDPADHSDHAAAPLTEELWRATTNTFNTTQWRLK
jgi:hypothetical protein